MKVTVTATLLETRTLYENLTGDKMPKDMTYEEALDACCDMLGTERLIHTLEGFRLAASIQ